MTVRTTKLGGTDWTDDEALTSADLNDTFGAVTIHRKVFDLEGPVSTTNTSWTDISGGNFTISSNNALILGMYITATVNASDSTAGVELGLKVSGTNLGTKYLVETPTYSNEANRDADKNNFKWGTSEARLFGVKGSSYSINAGCSVAPILKLLDSTTTFQFRFRSINTDGGSVSNIHCEVVYVELFSED